MRPLDRVELVLDAIHSVKARVRKAIDDGDLLSYKRLSEDLIMLECTLVPEAEALIRDIKKRA